MSGHRAPPGPADYALLRGLAVLWGMAFPLSMVAVQGYPPITLTLTRQLVAVLCLLVLFMLLRRPWRRPTQGELILIAVCSIFGSVLPFTLINWGVERVDSGVAAILMGFMPLLTIVLAHIFTHDDKLSAPKLLGGLMGLAGLCVLFWPALTIGVETIWRQLALIGAATCYAVNALVLRHLTHWPPLVLLVYIGFGTLIFLFPMSFTLENPLEIDPTLTQTIAMIALGIVAYTLGAFLMFAIIDRQGASFFGQINLLVPVAGVLLGALFLGERPGWNALAALFIIVAGVVVARLKFPALRPLKRKES